MRTNSEELSIFITVVQLGSFTKAADNLQIDNSVVSRTIKKLENKLGVTLFNRTTRQLNLTEEGEIYYQKIQPAMKALFDAEFFLREIKNKPNGTLRIDASTPVILHYLAPMIAPFKAQYPLIDLHITSAETYINLIDKKVDIAIRAGELADSSLKASLLFNSYRKIICSPDYIHQHGTPQTVADLNQHSCIAFTNPLSLNTWPLNDQFNHLYTIQPTLHADSGEIIKQLCLKGSGIACLSDFMVNQDIESGQLVELFADEKIAINMPFNAVYYSENTTSAKIRAFIDFIKHEK